MTRSLGIGFILLALLVAWSPVGIAAGKRTPYDKRFFEPTEEVVTPHIPWAKPYARGPVRVLYITHRTAMREAVEIAQRLSMKYKVFATEAPNKLGETGKGTDRWWRLIQGNSAEELAERLRRDLQPDYDVIVIANVFWDRLPIDCRYRILKKVKEGTGLVGYIPRGTGPYLKRVLDKGKAARPRDVQADPAFKAVLSGVPVAALPAFEKDGTPEKFFRAKCSAVKFGRGRVFMFHNLSVRGKLQGITPGPTRDPLEVKMMDYDYYLSLVIKAVLWAAGREPTVTVSALAPLKTADRADPSVRNVPFQVETGERQRNVSLELVIRNHDNEVVGTSTCELDLAPGKTRLDFPVPALPAGRYFADLWVKHDRRVLGWGSAAFDLTSQHSIAGIELEKESFTKKQGISGKVKLADPRRGLAVSFQLFDNFDRLIASSKTDLKAVKAEIPFKLSAANTLSIIQKVTVELRDGDQLLDRKSKLVPLSDFYPDREDVRWVMWDGFSEREFLARYLAREFYRHGVDTQYTGFTRWAFLENMWFLPYATRFIDKKSDWYNPKNRRTKEDLVRDPCLTDPAYLREVKEKLTKVVEQARAFSTNDISLGDECHFVSGRYDLCFSPTCLASFRQFVKKEYGSLDKLNKEYRTRYKSWDEVKPATLEQARKSGNFAPWVDHRRHMETVWAGIYEYSRNVIRKLVPGARVGYEGSDTRVDSYLADDFYKLMHAMDLNNIYFRRFPAHAVRDFAQPHTLFGAGWYGGYPSNRNEYHMRWFPWMALFHGANSFWVWMGHGNPGSVMAPDFSLFPFFKANVEEMAEIKRGIGKLLMLSSRQHDGIALLYSPVSVHVNTVTEGMPNTDEVLGSWSCILNDIGLQFRVIAAPELTEGKLTKGGFKILIMPAVQALSPREAGEIGKFAGSGGTVIADLRPGTTNKHGTPFRTPLLDALFGIRQNTSPPRIETGDMAVSRDAGVPVPPVAMPARLFDATVQLAGGRPPRLPVHPPSSQTSTERAGAYC